MAPFEHQDQVVPASVLFGFAGSLGVGLLTWMVIIKTVMWALVTGHPA